MSQPRIRKRDFAGVAALGFDPVEVEALARKWGEGECAALAARMHEWTGWRVLQLGRKGTWPVHWCVERPDRALVDAFGVFPDPIGRSLVAIRCERDVGEWTCCPPESLCAMMDDDDRREIDAALDTAWFEAVFPRASRRDAPIAYPNPEQE
ncbi:hypothetical protein SAMN05216360_102207 [Methylobacterium phyllostachyos]|uniref:Uncharacterized protein n=1 Tax=Methylobacterium phyllostachyos TaxID=582672 RepID=A0A1G9TJ48_9HYPH|nr:hypothetical protein [Methylobacterium phyllostachyos]SDM47799.1 hypothetical protein SAMN05216360_102207 [Methylobacterium phyllostachyos]